MQNSILKLTKELIRIPSVSSDLEELENVVNFVEKQFEGIEWVYIKKFVFNDKPSIVISNVETKHFDVILSGHLDVVPNQLDTQFDPVEKDWKLYARGAGDMKSWVAIMILLMKQLLKEKFSTKKVALMLTSDEEVWGFDGVAKLVEEWYTWEYVLIPDSGRPSDEIILKEKGILMFEAEFYGVAKHSSRPWMGKNAIDELMKFYQELKQVVEDSRLLYEHEDHWSSSVNLNVIHWGSAMNTLPDKVQAKFDIRFMEDFDSVAHVRETVQNLLTNYDAKLLSDLSWEMVCTSQENLEVKRYLDLTKKNLTITARFSQEHGGSDWRFFAALGSQVILHKPTAWSEHGKDERVIIDEFEKIYTIFYEFIVG